MLVGGGERVAGRLCVAGTGIRAFREGLKDEGKPAPPADAAAKVEAPKEDARG